MILSKNTPCQKIKIWQPRWKDRSVLIAKYKVGTHNEIVFEKAPSMPGSYYVSGNMATKCPIDNNGKLDCYVVPLDLLEPLERI